MPQSDSISHSATCPIFKDDPVSASLASSASPNDAARSMPESTTPPRPPSPLLTNFQPVVSIYPPTGPGHIRSLSMASPIVNETELSHSPSKLNTASATKRLSQDPVQTALSRPSAEESETVSPIEEEGEVNAHIPLPHRDTESLLTSEQITRHSAQLDPPEPSQKAESVSASEEIKRHQRDKASSPRPDIESSPASDSLTPNTQCNLSQPPLKAETAVDDARLVDEDKVEASESPLTIERSPMCSLSSDQAQDRVPEYSGTASASADIQPTTLPRGNRDLQLVTRQRQQQREHQAGTKRKMAHIPSITQNETDQQLTKRQRQRRKRQAKYEKKRALRNATLLGDCPSPAQASEHAPSAEQRNECESTNQSDEIHNSTPSR